MRESLKKLLGLVAVFMLIAGASVFVSKKPAYALPRESVFLIDKGGNYTFDGSDTSLDKISQILVAVTGGSRRVEIKLVNWSRSIDNASLIVIRGDAEVVIDVYGTCTLDASQAKRCSAIDTSEKTGSYWLYIVGRKNLSPMPVEYFKSPLTRICFTQYDIVPYSQNAGVSSSVGSDERPWEYVMYSDYSAPAELNDGTVKLDSDYHTENNRISMFAQREDGSVKGSAEITGGYISNKVEIGEMWLNK